MENESIETLGNNYIDAVRQREVAYNSLASAFGAGVSGLMRRTGQAIVDTSDEVESVLAEEGSRKDIVEIFRSVNQYMAVSQIDDTNVDFTTMVDVVMHCRKVLSPRGLLGSARDKLGSFLNKKAMSLMDSAETMVGTLIDYIEAVDMHESLVNDALVAMESKAMAEEDTY